MPSYETYARFYDALEGDRAAHADYIAGLVARHSPRAESVLELACGTGSVLKHLASRYEVAGVDLSPQMLERAAAKVPDALLVEADMRRVDLGRTFDVVLCVYDSLNHLLDFAEWETVFDRALAHLNVGGVFVFDVNTERRLASFAAQPPSVQWFGDGHLLVIDVTEDDGIHTWRLRIFEHVGSDEYRLRSEDIPETAFPVDRIRRSLAGRFRVVRAYDARRGRPSTRSERVHFVCRKGR